MRKRLGSILPALAMMLTLIPAFATGAAAETKTNATTLYIAGKADEYGWESGYGYYRREAI